MTQPRDMPLKGVTVLDFSRYLPAPLCSMILADFGAEVIRIEQPREVAKQEKVFGRDGLSADEKQVLKQREQLTRNKRSVLLNLRRPEARRAALRMAENCDVLLHDYRPGVMENMGLDYPSVRAVNSGAVYCAVSLAGQDGPYRDMPGHDPIALALSGALGRFGRDGEAAIPGLPVGDLSTGLQAVIGVLLALRERDQSGEGQLVDIAMSDCALGLMTSVLQRYLVDEREPPLNWRGSNQGLWRTRDGKTLCTTDLEPAYWETFCYLVNRPDLIPLQFDPEQQDYLQHELQAVFASRTRDEWSRILREAGTQAAPVYNLHEALRDPHARARGTVSEHRSDQDEAVTQVGPAIKLSRTPGGIRELAHMPGEDTQAVLQKFGFSAGEIAALMQTE